MARTRTRKSRARDDRRKPIQIERDIEAELDDEHAERLRKELANAADDPDKEAFERHREMQLQANIEFAMHLSMLCKPSCGYCRAEREDTEEETPGLEEGLDELDAARQDGED
jgi:hypothetical protein